MKRSLAIVACALVLLLYAAPVWADSLSALDKDYNKGVAFYYAGNFKDAAKWFREAAEQGHSYALFTLGVMYDQGQGVPQNYSEAAKWYRKAAEQGHATAQFNLGVMYRLGLGVHRDVAEAMEWHRRAANQGHAAALYNLGLLYRIGRSVPQDYVLAYMWFNLAASRGNEPAEKIRELIATKMTPQQVEEGQRLARDWKPNKE